MVLSLEDAVQVGNLARPRGVSIPMRMLWIAGPLLLATFIVGCSSEPPKPVEMQQPEPSAQAQRAVSESAQESEAARPPSAPQSSPEPEAAESRPVEQAERKASTPNARQAEDEDSAAESVAEETNAGDSADSGETAQPAPKDLTDVPATVVGVADVRVRPGLPWPVVEQLSAGEQVVVLNAASGWFRIRFGDDRVGWIQTPALDLGEVERWWIREEGAPMIMAEWQSEQYGVMGQSADGAEVRLLVLEDELGEIVSAPLDEVTLLADDITLRDLPILIGDETVVFPGDDFGVGQGRILPRANEWMWLPWGWLLAHNDEYIWQWRPQTDELEFVRRPPGPAKLSPSGQHLAILASPSEFAFGKAFQDLIVMPLDGSAPISLRQQFHDAIATGKVGPALANYTLLALSVMDLSWSADGKTIAVRLYPETRETYVDPALLLDTSGRVTVHQGLRDGIPPGLDCYVGSLGGNTSLLDWWWLREDNTFAMYGLCVVDEDGPREEFDIVFSLGGDFLRIEPFSWRKDDEAALELVRSAQGGELLGEWLSIDWSPTGRIALVLDRSKSVLRSFHAKKHQLREFSLGSTVRQSPGAHGVELDHVLSNLGQDLGWEVYWSDWEVYWFDGETAAVIIRAQETIVAGFMLDMTEGGGVVLDLGPGEFWPCQRTASWRPDGRQFQLTVGRVGFLLMVFGSHGQIVSVMHVAGHHHWNAAPLHQAAWSANGEWFAIGGDPQPTQCLYGH